MPLGTELKFIHERAHLSLEVAEALSSFAPEKNLTAPLFAGHSTYASLASDIPFILHPQPVPPAPMRAARGRARLALAVIALLAAAGWGVYEYEARHPIDLDSIAAWASHLASPPDAAITPVAAPPSEQVPPNDSPPTDPLLASNESAASPAPDRTADTNSNAPGATVSEAIRPTAAKPESTGTSGSQADSVRNLSGEWRLDTQVETSDSTLEGLKLHYEIVMKQDGDRVAGSGTKITEAGPATETPVTMTGTIAGNRLTLNFVELATQPETRGKFVLLVNDAGMLRGRFSSSGTRSSGHVEAHRVSSAQ